MNYFNFLKLIALKVVILCLVACDQPYITKKIELNFQDTTWHLEDNPDLGVIQIKKNNQFCIDRPLAEKLYPKDTLGGYKKTNICGDFKFDENERRVYFDLTNYSYSANILRTPDDIYFIPVTIGGISGQESILIQKD